MSKNQLVSVIVTVYNKDEFIEDCIRSILFQTYYNLQIIIVDDGSSDDSFKLCKKLVLTDKRCTLIGQSNKGVSSARNLGLSHVLGSFVLFVDGDDYLDENYIKLLMKYSEFDLVQSGFKKISENRGICYFSPNEKVMKKNRVIKSSIFNNDEFFYFSVPWSKLYKTDIIKKNDIRFVNQSYGEDTIFVLDYLSYCRSVVLMPETGYINNEVYGSLSRKKIHDLWFLLKKILPNNSFIPRYSKEWMFLYLRNIKLYLLNSNSNYFSFKQACKRIYNDKYTKQISLVTLSSWSNRVVFVLIKYKLWFALFCLVKVKNSFM